MSVTWTKRNTGRSRTTSWSSVAFIVESMLLLLFLVGSLAILTQVFTSSLNRSVESRTLDAATIAAGTIAEHFAQNPEDVQARTQLGDLVILCNPEQDVRAGGVLHKATIEVYDTTDGSLVYTLHTSRYMSGAE